MSKIERFNGNLEAFGSAAIGTERTIFGDTAQADDLTSQINDDFKRGWGVVGVNDAPTKQDFSALGYASTQLSAYLHQVGVPEWSGGQEYHLNSFVNRNGVIYRCKTNSLISATPPESNATNWVTLTDSAGLYDRSNVVGTVSQSGGVQTGAIIELGGTQTNGYIKFAGGLIMQWMALANGGTSGSKTALFPIAFPTLCSSVAASALVELGGTSGAAYIGAASASSRTTVVYNIPGFFANATGQYNTAPANVAAMRIIAIGF